MRLPRRENGLVLQDVQQLGLQTRRHFADFVKQDGAFVAKFELARLGVGGAGESSGFVPKQFAFQQIGGHRRAVHFEESAVGARGELVDQARQHFLAGTAFPQQKDGDFDVGDQRRLRTNFLHRRAGSDEEYIVAKFFDFARIALTFGRADALSNDRVKFGFLEGLGEIIDRPQAHRLHHLARVIHAREHHHFQSRLEVAELFESL